MPKSYTYAIIAMVFCQISLFGQSIQEAIAPTSLKLSEVEKITMPALDNESLRNAELSRRAPGVANKFAENIAVDLNSNNSGHWELTNDQAIWRLRITSKNALSLNLGFSTYLMPEGGSLVIYDEAQSKLIGPFTQKDNDDHRQLWTPIIQSDAIVIEVVVPLDKKDDLKLQLSYVNHDFMGFGNQLSGSCNLDVICGTADGWDIVEQYRDIIRSVAVIGMGGGTSCTGFLINNVNSDGTPFFMTADHCGVGSGNAASLVAYWKYENSTCRQPGSAASGANGDGQLNIFNTGSSFRAGWSGSDFTLVELDDPIPPEAEAFLAGYSLDITPSQDTTIGIHHPSTDEKRISFEFDPTYRGNWGQGNAMIPDGNHIIVPDWDIGTTEGGSSGSPLFDKNKRVIGQLHGGGAACGNDLYDSYGWIVSSWEGGGTPGTRLKDWLDPNNTGITTVDGLDLSYAVAVTPSVRTVCYPDVATYELSLSDNFTGPVTLGINPAPPAGIDVSFSENPVMPGNSATLNFSFSQNVGDDSFIFTIDGSDGTNSTGSVITLNVLDGAPSLTTLQLPANNDEDVATDVDYQWEALMSADLYDFQLASDASFTNIITTETDLEITEFMTEGLQPLTTYYWRVRAVNNCGIGDWTDPFIFKTNNVVCSATSYAGDPVAIGTAPEIVIAEINVSDTQPIENITIQNIIIDHTYIGDLAVRLIAPSGKQAMLFDRIGVPASGYGCPESNLVLSFDDDADLTAEDLENTCGGDPAAEGTFQPIDPLAIFVGDNPEGVWTLEVTDAESQDGGAVVNWDLQLCGAVVNNTDLTTQGPIVACQNETQSFELFVGTAYEAPVNLVADGIPTGTTVEFSQNPVDPGSTVQVTIQTGTTALGNYTISFSGDDGINAGTGEIMLSVIGAPDVFNLLIPADAAIDLPQTVNLSWAPSATASSYQVDIFERGTSTIAFTTTTADTFADFLLPIGGKYDWMVTAINDCGMTESMDLWSFDIIGDLAFNLANNQISGCIDEALAFSLEVGAGYFAPAMITTDINNNPDTDIAFDSDIMNVQPGSTITGTITFNPGSAAGNYNLLFIINDGTHNSQTQLTISLGAAPLAFNLTLPADGTEVPNLAPTLNWGNSPNADEYLVEIAGDADFNNIIISNTVSGNLFAPSNDLEPGTTYFWRITATSNCGSITSEVFSFTTVSSGVINIGNAEINILPNPFNSYINLNFESDYSADEITWELFTADGKVLQRGFLNTKLTVINTNLLVPGIYFVRLKNKTVSHTERLIKL